jgi:hypothetical protein
VNEQQKNRLEELLRGLKQLNEELLAEEPSPHWLETANTPYETVVSGNAEGLIFFAAEVLNLAKVNVDGAHSHFDEHSMLDKCERPLVVALRTSRNDA